MKQSCISSGDEPSNNSATTSTSDAEESVESIVAKTLKSRLQGETKENIENGTTSNKTNNLLMAKKPKSIVGNSIYIYILIRNIIYN